MNDLIFTSGTQPFGSGSQMCLNFSIIDDQLVEPTERFTVCGRSSQNTVEILNNGCTEIKIGDNDGMIIYNILLLWHFDISLLISYCSSHFSILP